MAFDNLSRYRRSTLYVDDGILRTGQKTTFVLGHEPVRFREREDNQRWVARLGDTWPHLSTVFYKTPRLWWVIADYQPDTVMEPLAPIEAGRLIYVPSFEFVRSNVLR